MALAAPGLGESLRPNGIGTAFAALAELLAEAGHEVTILNANEPLGGPTSDGRRAREWRRRRVRFATLPAADVPLICAPSARRSYLVYQWLKAETFDVLHVPARGGIGYYAQLAKRQGLAFAGTDVVVHASATTWRRLSGNGRPLGSVDDVLLDYLERRSTEWADMLASPSAALLDDMNKRGWSLPARAHVQPWPTPPVKLASNPGDGRMPVQEIAFFGRLEPRKGLVLFCDALDRLFAREPAARPAVTFLGEHVRFSDFDSAAYIAARSRSWPVAPKQLLADGARAAARYLRRPGCIAVVPSVADHAPMTVAECLAGGIPFLASAVGDIAALIGPADRATATFSPDPPGLCERLAETIRLGARVPRPVMQPDVVRAAWLAWHATPTPAAAGPASGAAGKAVTVCMAHRNRGTLLRQALASLETQTHRDLEVVLVDDGSDDPATIGVLDALADEFTRRRWTLLRGPRRGATAARNRAAQEARGEFLLFMDDDNVARPNEVEALVRTALATGADIVTCAFDAFEGNEPPGAGTPVRFREVPVGAAAGFGVLANGFGDTNGLIRRETFAAIGGFDEDGAASGRRGQDWHLWFKAVARGYRLETVPEPLFWYRFTANSLSRRPHGAREPRTTLDLLRAHPDMPREVRDYAAALSLAAGLNRDLNERDLHPIQSQFLIDFARSLTRSRSWTVTRPLRDAAARWRRRPAETPAEIHDSASAIAFINRVHSSMSWELTAPVRLAAKALRHLLGGRGR